MKIGVISDTHLTGYSERLQHLIDRHFADVEMILHAGDLVDLAVLSMFGTRDVRAVSGNMDPPSVREVLPEWMVLELGGLRIGLVHGWGSPAGMENRLLRVFDRVDCLVFGHSHQPMNRLRDGVLLFNPGSATDRRFASRNSLGILNISGGISGEIIELPD
ncbi:MAG: metallophosphoesterase family protein [Deltaproteobacteria bacterium]|nr:metallophosphoesterase family protein [Deltaproteobacteria bacterium]